MIICEVFQDSKLYVFKSKCQISKGTHVMVDTMFGSSYGVVAECFTVSKEEAESDLFKRYLNARGAYEPLKEIIGVFIPMTWVEAKARSKYEDKVR